MSDRQNFFAYFFLGQGYASLQFSDRNFKKNFGKKFPPRGVRPPNILEKWIYPPYGNVPANFHPDISKTVACKRVLKFKKRNSSTFEATPPSPGGPGPQICFLLIFSWVSSMTPSTFQIEILQKILGKKFPPGGV